MLKVVDMDTLSVLVHVRRPEVVNEATRIPLTNLLAGTSTPCREIQSTVSVETRIEHDANAINGSSSVYW